MAAALAGCLEESGFVNLPLRLVAAALCCCLGGAVLPSTVQQWLFEAAGRNTVGGHNFGVLLPWWDMLFGTASFEPRYDPTGVRDQLEQGRDYGRA